MNLVELRRRSERRTVLGVVFAGVVGAVLGAMAMGQTRTYFAVGPLPPEIAARVSPFQPLPPDANAMLNANQRRAATLNSMLSFGALATITVPLVGIAAGWLSSAGASARRGLLTGLLVGPLGGASAGAVAVQVQERCRILSTDWQSAAATPVAHAVAWVVFSLAVVATVMAARGERTRWFAVTLTVAAAAGLASLVFDFAAMVATPLEQSDFLIPTGIVGRLAFACLPVALMTATIAASPTLRASPAP